MLYYLYGKFRIPGRHAIPRAEIPTCFRLGRSEGLLLPLQILD